LLITDQERAEKFPESALGRLRWMCDEFDPDLLQADSVKWLVEKIFGTFPFPWGAFQSALDNRRFTPLMKKKNVPAAGLLLCKLIDASSRPMSSTIGANELMTEYARLVSEANLDAVYVLIDQLDTPTEAQQNPALIASIVDPILQDQRLMNGTGWAFKIFLPAPVRNLLMQPNTRVAEFIRKHELSIEWDTEDLRKLLHSRLQYFSGEKYATLEELAQSENVNSGDEDNSAKNTSSRQGKNARSIEEDLLSKAAGSPRRLLQYGRYLFEACASQTPRREILTRADWHQALARFTQDTAQGPLTLRLDLDARQVFKGSLAIKLTKLEYAFLKCLVEHNGKCERATIVKYVWGPGAEDDQQMVAQLVQRIREKIEPDRDNPVYLITERRYGFQLNLEGQ
jgi:hypothetical protein